MLLAELVKNVDPVKKKLQEIVDDKFIIIFGFIYKNNNQFKYYFIIVSIKMNKNETILDNELFVEFEQLVTQLNELKTQITGIQQNIKQLEKNVKKKMKGIKKEVSKTKNKGNRKPSGFAKPSKVTKELCEFMNKSEGSEIARTEVTRTLVAYIKENKLENTSNSKFISPDNKLKALLELDDNQELTYFNIQKFMNKHFVKNAEA
jgi:chromatin remodeling complex protein RSC6